MTQTESNVDPPRVVVDGFSFGEGPRWHEDRRLWFSDILEGRIYSIGQDNALRTEAEVHRPSGLGWLPDGALLVSTLAERGESGRSLGPAKLLRIDSSGSEVLLDMGDAGASFNDIVVGPTGDAYLDFSLGGILLVRLDGTHEEVASEIERPNGLGITPDGRTLLVNATAGGEILAFTISSDGRLRDRRVFAANIPTPDGLCVDAEGAVWIGSYSTSEFRRVADGGEILGRVGVPYRRWAVAPMLGGADRRTLFMLTAETSLEAFRRGLSIGRLESVRVAVAGVGWP